MGILSEARAFAPSKRVGSLLIIVAAIIVVVIVFRNESSSAENTPMRVTLSDKTARRAETEEKDSDGDGLKDWEEALWGLNAIKSDSDEDGTGDYQEVENRRKTLADVPTTIIGGIDPDAPAPTATELAGKILLSQFLTAKQVGVPLTEDSIAVAGKIALGSTDVQRSYPVASMSDLNIVDRTMSAKEYGNKIGAALLNTSGTQAPSELSVMLAYVQSADSEKLQKDMAAVIERYDMTIKGFVDMEVPADRAADHLLITNALITVRTDLVDLSKVGDDPFMAITALDAYQRDSALMTGLFERLRAALLNSDASFVEGEPGYVFVHAEIKQ